MDYLVFRLYGPLASWGDSAVGGTRRSEYYPGRSALLGLLGAALGITRQQDTEQQVLNAGYQFAIKQLCSGATLRDYHTVQAPDSVGKQVYRTRRDELITGHDRLGTVLSSREYRCDSKWLVAVKANPAARWALSELATALRKPRFQLSLGRKACVLAAPLAPQLCTAQGYKAALDNYEHPHVLDQPWQEQRWLGESDALYCWEGEAAELCSEADLSNAQQIQRHDQPVSRQRWQFSRAQHWLWQEVSV